MSSLIEKRFLLDERGTAQQAAVKLARDPYIFSAMKSFQGYTPTEQANFVEHFARAIASELGVFNPMVAPFNEESKDGLIRLGFFNPKVQYGPTVNINTNPKAFSNLDRSLHVIAHECGHYRQVAKLLRDKATAPEIAQRMRHDYQNYKNASVYGLDEYQLQLIERHANVVADTFMETFAGSLSCQNNLFLNPKETEAIIQELQNGRVAIPHQNGVPCTDPRRYYYRALATLKELRKRPQPQTTWHTYLSDLHKAVRYSEQVTGFNPIYPLNRIEDVIKGKIVKGCPEQYLKMAKSMLQNFSQSTNNEIRNRSLEILHVGEEHQSPQPTRHVSNHSTFSCAAPEPI